MHYIETEPERLFREAGPLFHLYTSPQEDNIILQNREDYVAATNLLAVTILQEDCTLLAYALMSNHFHFIIEGERSACLAFFEHFRQRIGNYLKRHRRGVRMDKIHPGMTPIENLKQVRNEICYVIRNPFVARRDANPLADPWSSGYLYFNPLLGNEGTPASELRGRALRLFLRSRSTEQQDSSSIGHSRMSKRRSRSAADWGKAPVSTTKKCFPSRSASAGISSTLNASGTWRRKTRNNWPSSFKRTTKHPTPNSPDARNCPNRILIHCSPCAFTSVFFVHPPKRSSMWMQMP